ncbi:C1 family peptidase [Alicyclobacillus fastidiosus]|uniref:Aminopeptidase n=1 Tax=Alicyclobacillus fastidiosus TaxID=392011 RepID=A0ABY6ZHP2_9BACL|nr:C1 family peptidase [Alicyclobacillus fastidiosus]WAH42138.1 C1 family peptidase [Alicyclobacillus fastidiosus]GMA63923.1 aminopeptidase C [Alicyclobacillus fastidiosus]
MATPIRTGNTAISIAQIQRYAADFHSSPANRVRMNAVTKSGIQSVATDRDAVARMQYTFSEEIDTGPVTNQKQSGRCWLFAGLNTIRQDIATGKHMAPFELSQSYQMFWDKFEKANYFLERILDTLDEDTDSRIVQWLLQAPLQDGGQWDMFVNLVEKYGVVPQCVMAESYHSSKSAVMNRLLTSKLRKEASDYRACYRQGTSVADLRDKKQLFLGEFYRLLCYFLGTPPTTFDFEYRDKDNVFHRDTGLTPQTFFEKYARVDLKDYVSIIHAPTSDKPYDRTYTVKYLGNVEGGNDVVYLNVDIDTVKRLALAQLQDGESVWFGCDVGKRSDSESGIMDARLFDYEGALDTSFAMTKAERLDYGESVMTHAMVFTGANVIDGKVNRWKVQNSWGKDAGKDGFFVMSDAWFDDYMYQIVVNKKHLSEANLSALAQTPIELSPWDPMGSLAMMR